LDVTFPQITQVDLVTNTIVFTGVNFYDTLYTATAFYNDMAADSVSITSTTEAIATFNKGVPISGEDIGTWNSRPQLIFKLDGSSDSYHAIRNGYGEA